jgi:hypothetical protein
MKIVRNTPEQLILRSVPWIMALVFSVFILVMIGFGLNALMKGDGMDAFWGLLGVPAFLGIFLVAFARRDEVILDRSRNLVELRHSTFLGRTRVQHAFTHLERAIMQAHSGSKGGTTYRVALVLGGGMDAGTHPVTPVYSSGNGVKRAVETINNWLSADIDSGSREA